MLVQVSTRVIEIKEDVPTVKKKTMEEEANKPNLIKLPDGFGIFTTPKISDSLTGRAVGTPVATNRAKSVPAKKATPEQQFEDATQVLGLAASARLACATAAAAPTATLTAEPDPAQSSSLLPTQKETRRTTLNNIEDTIMTRVKEAFAQQDNKLNSTIAILRHDQAEKQKQADSVAQQQAQEFQTRMQSITQATEAAAAAASAAADAAKSIQAIMAKMQTPASEEKISDSDYDKMDDEEAPSGKTRKR